MRRGRAADALDMLKPGMSVFVQGATGEPQGFIEALKADPDRASGVHVWSCLVPGINSFDYGSLPADIRVTTFMASPAIAPSIRSGRSRLLALPYSRIGEVLARTDFDLAIVQVAPPDTRGLCSFGVSCDTGAIVWPNARKCVAWINTRHSPPPRADTVDASEIDLAIEVDAPLLSPTQRPGWSAELRAIGRIAADLVPDGAAIQSGIGEAPAAVVAALCSHRRLRIRSGLITPEYRDLAEAGALAEPSEHLTGLAWGDAAFYDWLGQSDLAAFRSIPWTHGAGELAGTPGFTSINSALEIDLHGQANLEWRAGRRISSVGGAPDFVRGAAASHSGRSIIALPSTTRDGSSRIVARLNGPTVSIAGADTDVIVTEHGAAAIGDMAADERAEALIALAAPDHRADLAAAWIAGRQGD
ncbi:MAG: acetyl-CoA hydrolase/transferase C-terminal domain-containing protein [Alphaproteobacteria bacterium]|nr:acetyl-CoA hydrolase/transferase C-terminal domain-containing protein [Alphaproteobacteria bacterium]